MSHPIFARLYHLGSSCVGTRDHRRELLAGLAGRVIEVGCGDGANFTLYPKEVTEVLAVEPEAYLRARAQLVARRSPVPVRVVAGYAEALPSGDGAFDAAVTSLVLCSVGDLPAALAEIGRVLRPGGELRFYEHVQSPRFAWAAAQRRLSPGWGRIAGGCHLDRDPVAAAQLAGFRIDNCRSFDFPAGPRWAFGLVSPHVVGRARLD